MDPAGEIHQMKKPGSFAATGDEEEEAVVD